MYSLINVAIYQYQTTDWNKNILNFFLTQEKVYICKCDDLEYVIYRERNKDEYVNYEKKDIR